MKKPLILLAALAFTSANAALAQAPATSTATTATQAKGQPGLAKGKKAKAQKSPAQKADHKAGKMAKELGLNADQEARVEQLMLARQQEVAALKAKYGADKKAGRADMTAAQQRYESQLQTILTPEQYTKMNQLKAEHRSHDKAKGNGKQKAKA